MGMLTMSKASAAVPYEKQAGSPAQRDCGAACLSMVYRSLGKKVAQTEVWPAIAKENPFGSLASTSYLMVKDALDRGFSAVAFQARHPLQSLRLCCESGRRAILNHRLNSDSPTGHYSVLVDVEEHDVVLHDPLYGPSRRLPHAELLELWQPGSANAEIAGDVLIEISAQPSGPSDCWLCGKPMPASVACPRCHEPIGLQPSGALGCIESSCVARMWNFICCPSCDFLWNPGAEPLPAPGVSDAKRSAPPTPSPAEGALDLSPVFAELDKFCKLVLSNPAAASNPDVTQNLEKLAARREGLKQATATILQKLNAHKERMAKFVQEAAQKQEAHRKKMEELNRPLAPLDATALGRALLKNLGWDS